MWSTSWPNRFVSGKEHDARFLRYRVDARIVLNFVEKRNTPVPAGIRTQDRPACSLVALPSTVSRLRQKEFNDTLL